MCAYERFLLEERNLASQPVAHSRLFATMQRCDRSTPLGRRNYAILLLLARLGLRAGEVVRLNLEDIGAGRRGICSVIGSP